MFPEIEKKILKFWEDNEIFGQLRKKIQGKPHWSFLDGPITANNPMGVHHAWGRTYKDLFQRYKAMQGYDLRFQNGFDCQGLWVEVEVEKELGFNTKKDIEKYGIDKFVEKCKARVIKYSKIQTEQSIKLGQWMDWENSYYTMSDENNYAIWYFLKKCWEQGLLYKGRDVVPWCPRCGTAISQHEILTEEYKEISHQAIFVALPIDGEINTFFLVWTTTPWTLPANVALAVHSDLQYAKVRDEQNRIYILLKDKAGLVKNGQILETFSGKKLDGMTYKGMFDELPAVKETMKNDKHKVILWDEITLEEGTGIVHIAPGCGQEDFQLGKKFKLAVIDPLDDESRYKAGFEFLTAKLANQAAEFIFENLKNKGLVYRIENYLHRYPTCWRCKSELIFRLVDEWYISMEQLRKPLMETARKIKWIPDFGRDRELDWLKNMQDWLISKKRYWGLALPIYECTCGNFEVMGSKEELKTRAIEGWSDFEGRTPHRPWVDKIKIKCSKCAQIISRIADVGNPWLDAGIVPFSTMKYFQDRTYWKSWFPADFICESFPGQFKNWFYSLLVMSQVLEGRSPSKTIFGFASVRDEKGEEMHKSKGNAIEFNDAAEKIGSDVMRWMYIRQNPANNLNFGFKAAQEQKRKLLTLWNAFIFFQTYADKGTRTEILPKTKNILDTWIVSRLHCVILDASEDLDNFDAASASLAIENFFINDLSLWYIRRSRPRLQRPKDRKEKQTAQQVLYYVLLNLVKILSPMTPFLSEEIYQQLRADKMPISVHLCAWPKADKKLIDAALDKKMVMAREIVALALAERVKVQIKVRQPLSRFKIKSQRVKMDKDLQSLIQDEVNVKKIIFGAKIKNEIELDTKITKSLKEEGIVREVVRNLQEMRKKSDLKPKDKIFVYYSAEPALKKILEKNKKIILRDTIAVGLSPIFPQKEGVVEKEIDCAGMKLHLGIKRT
jgi:isoleucyl-tRNA synthetase